MRRGKQRYFFVFSLLLLLSACAAGPKFVKKDAAFPQRLAVLPMSNETNDVTGPETVRKVMAELLPLRGYQVQDIASTDALLLELGITDGGQLPSVAAADLGKKLGVDGLVYGNLLSFVDLPLGFVRKRQVKAEFTLKEAASDTLFWQDEDICINPELHLDAKEAKAALVVQIAERQVEKMTGQFLRLESELMILHALGTLPEASTTNSDAFANKIREKKEELRLRSKLKRSVLDHAK